MRNREGWQAGKRLGAVMGLVAAVLLVVAWASPAMAQESAPTPVPADLELFTAYPSQVIGMDEGVNVPLTLRTGTSAQVVELAMAEMPEGWNSTFKGGGNLIQSAYVQPGTDSSVSLRLDPPSGEQAGTYAFTVVARGARTTAELPLQLTVQEKVPPKLEWTVDLPTVMGKPSDTFRFNTTLENLGDEDLTVNLIAEAPAGFDVTFLLTGKEVTSLPVEANQSKGLTVEVRSFEQVPVGSYPLTVRAEGGEASAALELAVEVTGAPDVSLSTVDGRLSTEAYAGKDTPLKLVARNDGSAPARAVELSASEPSGWSVAFEPPQIAEIPAGQQAEFTALIRPADKALAGDYMLSVQARPAEGTTTSAEVRVTVLTSTLWGIVGIALIAIAVLVVAVAVMRFGRR